MRVREVIALLPAARGQRLSEAAQDAGLPPAADAMLLFEALAARPGDLARAAGRSAPALHAAVAALLKAPEVVHLLTDRGSVGVEDLSAALAQMASAGEAAAPAAKAEAVDAASRNQEETDSSFLPSDADSDAVESERCADAGPVDAAAEAAEAAGAPGASGAAERLEAALAEAQFLRSSLVRLLRGDATAASLCAELIEARAKHVI